VRQPIASPRSAPPDRPDHERVPAQRTVKQFSFTPGGAQLQNAQDDLIVIQPGLIQTQVRIDPAFTTNSSAATDKTVTIFKRAFARLKVESFLQCGIKVVAHVPLPGEELDAKQFVAAKLMPDIDPDDLAPGFFAGGVKYRRLSEGEEANLFVEPFVLDPHFLFIDYDVARSATTGPMQDLDHLATWIEESFSFVQGPTMDILKS
jgi:hypothetical protein